MRLPPELLKSIGFVVCTGQELVDAMGASCSSDEREEILRLTSLGLPPVTSIEALAVMMGFNRGFTWSLVNRSTKYYRYFSIGKGKKERHIEAPKVSLKIIQKWLSVHFQNAAENSAISHGFVSGRSHLTAASQHLGAHWVASFDIKDFFPSTPIEFVVIALKRLGYHTIDSLEILSKLCCINGRLSQGAPTSPILSNLALSQVDGKLISLANKYNIVLTRYADDIVFSGLGNPPEMIVNDVDTIFSETPWSLAEDKSNLAIFPKRLKVHGLLVHGSKIRLTKGYRNRLRMFRHLYSNGWVKNTDKRRILGHLNYSDYIDRFDQSE